MIRTGARTDLLVQRLRARGVQIAAKRAATHHRRATRADWYSAAALWPELSGDPHNGK